jgi:hypothetical protein
MEINYLAVLKLGHENAFLQKSFTPITICSRVRDVDRDS